MSRLLSKERVRDLLLGLALLCAVLSLMLWPQEAMEAAREGLQLCYNVIIPSLFPFFVLSALVVILFCAYKALVHAPEQAPVPTPVTTPTNTNRNSVGRAACW